MNDTLMNMANPAMALQLGQGQMANVQLDRAKGIASQENLDLKAAKQAAEDFEAVFLSQMMQPIFDTIPEDSLFGQGPGFKVYQGMLVQEMGKSIAKAGGVGIAKHVMDEIIKLQEG